jgi:hypothetical protein
MNVASSSKNYNDAKPSHLSTDELLFESKNRSDFERVKQKFDSRNSSKGSNSKNSSRKSDRNSQKLARSSEMSFNDVKNNMNVHENAQIYDDEMMAGKSSYQSQIHDQLSLEKLENTVDLAASFNLDGFKVSEDDDDVSSSGLSGFFA